MMKAKDQIAYVAENEQKTILFDLAKSLKDPAINWANESVLT
ncbi:MAG: hypothetical protein ACQEWW_19650 [Bacillota bacterium]